MNSLVERGSGRNTGGLQRTREERGGEQPGGARERTEHRGFTADRERRPFRERFQPREERGGEQPGGARERTEHQGFTADRERRPFRERFQGREERGGEQRGFSPDRERRPFRDRLGHERRPFERRLETGQESPAVVKPPVEGEQAAARAVFRPGPSAEKPVPSGLVLKATIEYDGTRYRGWQAQINARTVQGVLLPVLRGRLGEEISVQGAGRTDAGVHALAQVASIHLPGGKPLGEIERLRMEINDALPPDINVLSLAIAPAGFHARHSASLRIYRYRITRRRSAFAKPFVWWVKDRLNTTRMSEAASVFTGRHDFYSFCENPEGHDSTLVEVNFVRVETPAEEPGLILIRIGASHFLWKMVRRVVGVLVQIGTERIEPSEALTLLNEKNSRCAPWTAPPSGLFLESVLYPGEQEPAPVSPLRPAY